MQAEQVQKVIHKLNNILATVRFQNSGADVHEVNSIRHTCMLLIEQLEDDPDCMKDELVLQIANNTQNRLVEFYKRKYS